MTKIKLVNYPYLKFGVGEICDFGEEKNASLVSLQRAVWYDEGEIKKIAKKAEKARIKAQIKAVVTPEPEEPVKPKKEDQPVIEVTKPEPKKESKKATSFWDRLK